MQDLLDRLKSGDSAVSAMLWLGLGLLILVVVIAIALWLIRALRPTLNMSGTSTRGGRVQRLAVTDAFTLDREGRKLVIVRRDNVEHLLLIGGPNDLVVESSIVRSERQIRGRAEGEAMEPLSEPSKPAPNTAMPGTIGAAASAAQPSQRPVAPPPPPIINPRPQPAPLSTNVGTPSRHGMISEEDFEQALRAMEAPTTNRPAPAPAPQANSAAPQPRPAPPLAATPPAVQPSSPAIKPAPPSPSPRQEPMSEMARRLSEVLQKPIAPPPKPPALATQPPAARPPSPQRPPSKPDAAEVDQLEEEMAKLLGRPNPPPR
jgi:hypothetical protein